MNGDLGLLVERHGHDAVLELGREELQLALELLALVQRLQRLQAAQPHLAHLTTRAYNYSLTGTAFNFTATTELARSCRFPLISIIKRFVNTIIDLPCRAESTQCT